MASTNDINGKRLPATATSAQGQSYYQHGEKNIETNPRNEPVVEDAQQQVALALVDSIRPADPVPDGGLTAWLQVAGCFILFFNSW